MTLGADVKALLEHKYALALAGHLIPERLALETTNRCNAHCVMCARQGMTRPLGCMSEDDHIKLLERFGDWRNNIRSISHAGIGDPLMDPTIAQKIKAEKQYFPNAKVHLYSNGSLADGPVCDQLLASGLDSLSFSINAFYKDTYESIMGLKYEKTLCHILACIDKRNQSGRSMAINVSMIPQPGLRENEIADFQAFWKLRADQVCLPVLVSWGNYHEAADEGHDYGLAPCQYLWDVFLLDYNGVVKLCCEDFNTRHPVGNIYHERAQTLFNSSVMNKLRKRHLDGDFSFELCRGCSESGHAALVYWENKAKKQP